MNSETHPFQVSIWVPGNNNSKSLFERGVWSEMARCNSRSHADEVALSLSIRHPDGVQIAEWTGERFVGYKYLPEAAKELR